MKCKFIIPCAFLSAMLLTIAGCSPKPMDEETVEAFKEELFSQYEEGIYGNIFMPEELNGASISWKSSDEEVINSKWDGEKAPGVVTRYAEDIEVTLTANIKKDGTAAKIEEKVTVKAAVPEVYDNDYVGYLFCHFTGQEGSTTDEQIYFALADEGQGLKFTDMSSSPALTSNVGDKGVRDPFIYRSPEGDTYRIIGTDLSVKNRGGWTTNHNYTKKGSHSITLWESHDLKTWSEPRLIEVAAPEAGMAWAPEMIYHEETGQYLIYFSSTICNEEKTDILERDCIYYTTTRDFVHFSETKKFFKNQKYPEGQKDTQGEQRDTPNADNTLRKIIDASVIKIGDWYYLAAKDGDNHENYGGILISRTKDLFDVDSWDEDFQYHLTDLGLSARVDLNNKQLEGPEWFYYNAADRGNDPERLGLMGDMYMNGQGYLPLSTTDIEDRNNSKNSWKVLGDSDYSWTGLKKRHGSIMRLTREEIAAVKEFYNK